MANQQLSHGLASFLNNFMLVVPAVYEACPPVLGMLTYEQRLRDQEQVQVKLQTLAASLKQIIDETPAVNVPPTLQIAQEELVHFLERFSQDMILTKFKGLHFEHSQLSHQYRANTKKLTDLARQHRDRLSNLIEQTTAAHVKEWQLKYQTCPYEVAPNRLCGAEPARSMFWFFSQKWHNFNAYCTTHWDKWGNSIHNVKYQEAGQGIEDQCEALVNEALQPTYEFLCRERVAMQARLHQVQFRVRRLLIEDVKNRIPLLEATALLNKPDEGDLLPATIAEFLANESVLSSDV
jgi:hypothetical protein